MKKAFQGWITMWIIGLGINAFANREKTPRKPQAVDRKSATVIMLKHDFSVSRQTDQLILGASGCTIRVPRSSRLYILMAENCKVLIERGARVTIVHNESSVIEEVESSVSNGCNSCGAQLSASDTCEYCGRNH